MKKIVRCNIENASSILRIWIPFIIVEGSIADPDPDLPDPYHFPASGTNTLHLLEGTLC